MAEKPTYEELEQRLKELEKTVLKCKQAEEVFHEPYQLLETVINELPFWFSLKDEKGRYLLVNQKIAEAHGVTVSDFINRTTLHTPELHPGGLIKMLERDNQVLKTGERLEVPEYSITTVEGLRWRRLVKVPWKRNTGEIIGVISWSEDITHRKRAEEESIKYRDHLEELVDQRTAELQQEITDRKQAEGQLLQSEKSYRILAENPNSIVMRFDAEGNILFVNKYASDLFGYTIDEMIGKKSADLIHSKYGSNGRKTKTFYVDLLKNPEKYQTNENENITKDGKVLWISWSNTPTYEEDGTLSGLISTGFDISERKQAEEALKKSQSLLSQTEKIGKVGGWEFNIETVKQTWTEEIYNIHEVDLTYDPTVERGVNFYTPASRPIIEQAVQRTIEHGEPFDLELEIITAKGNLRSVHAIGKADLEHSKIYGFFQDITERKQADQEKEKLKSQLIQSQKMEAIGTLAGGIAHDFNNILTTIIGNAHLALMEVDKDGPLREEIGEIKVAGERAASLTRQLLAFSRKQVIQPKILDLNELLTGLDKLLGRLIGEDVEMLMIPEPELWRVEADPGQMEQTIMNLVINAKDAMPKGGKLTIEMANVDLDGNYFREHGVREEQPGSYVMLAVSDTGIGMDKETKERIFEPFYTTKEIGKGTGLGLSTIYGIVKQNKGFIWAYSEPGQGSAFKVYLPKVKRDAEPDEKKQSPAAELDGSETILLVEDDDSLRKLARIVLKKKGCKVLEAENGEVALRVSEVYDGPIDLLITDVVMPKMGGKEVAKRLQPLYPYMKVLYMSGYTDKTIVRHGVLEPGLNFIEKPFKPNGLARKVTEILNTKE